MTDTGRAFSIPRNSATHYPPRAQGDTNNAILAAAGCNFSLLLKWFWEILWLILKTLLFRPTTTTA